MTVSRRDFVTTAAAGSAAACVAAVSAVPEAHALQREPLPLPPEAVGLLYDSTLCIGCKACVKACKEANDMPLDISTDQEAWNQGKWDTPVDLSADTLNIIKAYTNGTMETKDVAVNGFAFTKNQCLHCLDPSCVSACPVSAMLKDELTGLVSHEPDRCIGCRYCVLSCPFGVPKYDYDDPFGEIKKCELCDHKLAENELPGCVDVCPTGATLFGPAQALRDEAERRIAAQPGDVLYYPTGDISGTIGGQRFGHEKLVEVAYQPEAYGLTELGGTQCLKLSAVPYDKLGMPVDVPDYGYPSLSEGIQHTLYKGLIAPAVIFAGLAFLARRNHAEDEDHSSEAALSASEPTDPKA